MPIPFAIPSTFSDSCNSVTCTLPDGVKLGVVILAAGQGTRMHSPLPKVLQQLLDEPILRYVLASAHQLLGDKAAEKIWTVIGHKAELVHKATGEGLCNFALQKEQLGTGHALQAAWPEIFGAGLTHILVINGDTPLARASILSDFIFQSMARKASLSFISLNLENPGSFGRVIRNKGIVAGIIEAKDYDPTKYPYESNEINAGIYCLEVAAVNELLPKLANSNKSKEYYITDLIGLAAKAGLFVEALSYDTAKHILGINNPRELLESEEFLRSFIIDSLIDKGVIIHSPQNMRVGPFAFIEAGVELFGPGEIYGNSVVKKGAKIESNCYIKNTKIEAGAHLRSFCHAEESIIGKGCTVGPFSRMRAGSILEENAHIGNFVEMKKTRLGKGAKAGHLAYLGDSEIGSGVNIGAGVITCNYDGKNKYKTNIAEGAFIGSNSSLVAPVSIGREALVGAGSVITKDVPEHALAIGRGIQRNMEGRSKVTAKK